MVQDVNAPVILGLDTSGHHCAVGLLCPDGSVAAAVEEMAKGQAERLMPMIEELLARHNTTWGDLTALAVGTGPGNFTGIRISVSAVRGLALGLGIPAIGVSNFELKRHIAGGQAETIQIPAPRNHRYVQSFDASGAVGSAHHEPTPEGSPQPDPIDISELPAALIAVAQARLPHHDGTAPAPMYVKAPDAAPARQSAPALLP